MYKNAAHISLSVWNMYYTSSIIVESFFVCIKYILSVLNTCVNMSFKLGLLYYSQLYFVLGDAPPLFTYSSSQYRAENNYTFVTRFYMSNS